MTTATAFPLVYGKRLDDLDVLARSPLLRGLPIKDLSSLLDALDQVALPAGTVVFREGETAELMYFVLEGEARMRRGRLELHPLRPGDAFGEAALLASRPRGVTVETHTTMRLARLSRSRYLSFAANHPRAALHFTQALATMLGDQVMDLTDDVGLFAHQRTLPRRTRVRVRRDADEIVVPTGTLVGAVLPREHDGIQVVGGLVNARTASLEQAIVSDVSVVPATLASVEGREIYARSAALLVLEAARRAPSAMPLRAGPPLETGQVFLSATAGIDAEAHARRVAAALENMRREDVPLREEVWSTDEARMLFLESGAADVATLLQGRRESTVTLASCGETFALGMGSLLPRASLVSRFVLRPHPAGLLLELPELRPYMPIERGARVDPLASETTVPRYNGPMTSAERRWLEGLGVTSVGSFNAFCVANRVPELVRIAEGFHEKWLGRIVDTIVARRDALQVIAIAGPSSSAKTTFINRLTVQLQVEGIRPVSISLDDYYVDRERTVRDEHGEFDFEAFEALDAALLRAHVARLLRGERVRLAAYDFRAGKSRPDGGAELAMAESDVLLLEGIHGLDPALLDGVVAPERIFRVFVHPATTLPFDRLNVFAPDDLRLVRRIVRDRHQRNYTARDTIARWPSVRNGELRRIYPYLGHADAVFDSSLVYEPSILKTYAERYLLEVPPGDPATATAHRLRKLLDPFVTIYPDEVPATSVIREFIGGSAFV